jgi:membrane protease YdiL (CAAX protease family)
MKKFFRRHQGRGSYDLFSSYSHYLPKTGGIFMLLLLFLIGAGIGQVTVIGLTKVLGADFTSTYGTIISYPIMFIPVMLYASVKSKLNEYSTPKISLDRNEFGKFGGLRLGLIAVLGTLATAFVVEPLTAMLPPMPEEMEKIMKALLENSPLWVTLLSVSVFAPLFEEWLCRGLVLRGLLHNKMHPISAIIISSVFFAALHANLWQAIPAFILGALFGYAYYKTGSLKLTMAMHCANNTFAAVMSKIPAFKDAETFMDILSPWAYACVFAACLLIVVCTLVILRSPYQTESRQGEPS